MEKVGVDSGHMGSKKKILVVDDEPATLSLVRSILRHEKFDVLEALSGEEALEILENETVDLVISDLRMPGMSGVELLDELREWDGSLPVIFISGWGKEKDWLEAVRANASALIEKPFRKDVLVKAVRRALEERESVRAAS